MDASLIERISSSILYLTSESISATAIVWDYVGDKVLILTNYHTWNIKEYKKIFPQPPKESLPKESKKKRKVNEDDLITLSNETIQMSFPLSSETFLCYNMEEDYAVLQLPKDGFTMERIPITLNVGLCLKIHAFGYIGHTKEFNVTHGEISSMIPHGFTMSLLSAPGYSGAAILSDGAGRAVGYMGGNLDASTAKNSQHQSYAFKFDTVITATHRTTIPTSSPSGKSVRK